jgi:hypothetical protein
MDAFARRVLRISRIDPPSSHPPEDLCCLICFLT